MKKHFYLILGILIILIPILVSWLNSKEKPVEFSPNRIPQLRAIRNNPHLEDVLEKYERELHSSRLITKTPGAAIAVVKDSTIVYLKGFGVREAGTTDSVNVNTVFRIASVSKSFASFLTGILVQEGVLSWNDHVVKYLPEFRLKSPEQTQALTITHVLSHTTGLPMHAYTTLVEDGMPLPDMLAQLADVDLVSDVGAVYSYQNVAYSLIGEVIKSATGKSYEAWMIEKVFGPLHMKNASIDYFSIISNENHAKPHMPVRGGWRLTRINNTYYNVAPAGGINASIADMAQWMIALLGHRQQVITADVLNHLYTPVIKAPSKNRNYRRMRRLDDSYYGLGWRILYYPEDTLVYHGGYVNGFRSEVAVNQKEGIAICILANAAGELPDKGIPLFFKIYNEHRREVRLWDERQHQLLSDTVTLF
jgi:beta-lactamase class C